MFSCNDETVECRETFDFRACDALESYKYMCKDNHPCCKYSTLKIPSKMPIELVKPHIQTHICCFWCPFDTFICFIPFNYLHHPAFVPLGLKYCCWVPVAWIACMDSYGFYVTVFVILSCIFFHCVELLIVILFFINPCI